MLCPAALLRVQLWECITYTPLPYTCRVPTAVEYVSVPVWHNNQYIYSTHYLYALYAVLYTCGHTWHTCSGRMCCVYVYSSCGYDMVWLTTHAILQRSSYTITYEMLLPPEIPLQILLYSQHYRAYAYCMLTGSCGVYGVSYVTPHM